MSKVTVSAATQVLAHTPGLARHGSKPSRELPKNPEVQAHFLASLRTFEQAVDYLPHQAYVGALHPRDLPPRPWLPAQKAAAVRFNPDGELMPEYEFLALMALVDEFDLLTIDNSVMEEVSDIATHPLAARFNMQRLAAAAGDAAAKASAPGGLALHLGADRLAGAINTAHEADESLAAFVLLENLACKATGVLAMLHLLEKGQIEPESIDYVISCSEEAVGDRYQRGGGNMAKAVASAAGLSKASGADVKNFCAAPIPAMVIAASLVSAGVFNRVAVVAGGSLPKLGMKFQGHLKNDLPVLEDVIGGSAFLVEKGDGPAIRLDAVGRHSVEAGASNPQIMEALAVEPLGRVGLKMTEVDDYATELHNPEITEPQGSGNVPERNYKTIAALAARKGEISRDQIDEFVTTRGMPGFAPTQGHLASSICYLPHALRRMNRGDAARVHMIAKGSLFLGRMSQLSDGMSVLLEQS